MAKIAIVDDSRLARTYTATVVRKLGHEVVEIDPSSIFDVLKLLREQEPDVLLTDYLMPNCPGVSLARACREDHQLRRVKLIVVTAHRDEDVISRLERMGVQGFLHKPFDPPSLQELLERVLATDAAP
jgi:two-component system, chemotaxis family, chemotaxis protein CheY